MVAVQNQLLKSINTPYCSLNDLIINFLSNASLKFYLGMFNFHCQGILSIVSFGEKSVFRFGDISCPLEFDTH